MTIPLSSKSSFLTIFFNVDRADQLDCRRWRDNIKKVVSEEHKMNSTTTISQHGMNELIKQIKIAMDNKLYYLALFSLVTIPDICCALESENYETSGSKYKSWFNNYMVKVNPKKYGSGRNLDADQFWKFRCSLLHQGNTSDQKDYKRLLFIEPGSLTLGMHNVDVGSKIGQRSLLIDMDTFAADVISSVEMWLRVKIDDPNCANNSKRLIQRYPIGVNPVFGIPVIG